VQDSAKLVWSSPATVSSVIGSVGLGAFHSWEVFSGDNKDSQMDVVHRLQFAKKPQVFPIIKSSPTNPDDDGLVLPLDEIHRSQSVKKTQITMSVDVGFLWRDFLKPRPSRSRGCSSPTIIHPPQLSKVSSAQVSNQEDFVDDPHLSVVTLVSPSYLRCSSSEIPANDKDGVSNGEEVKDRSLEFPDAIEEDFLRIIKLVRPKNKGRREVLNLNSSINYDNTSVSSWRGKGKAHVL
jgi:hypothetical protein